MDWVEDESIRLLCPCLADVFVGCETPQGFQPAAEVVGGEEVGQVGSELVVRLIVVAVDGRLLEGAVHPLDLAVIWPPLRSARMRRERESVVAVLPARFLTRRGGQ